MSFQPFGWCANPHEFHQPFGTPKIDSTTPGVGADTRDQRASGLCQTCAGRRKETRHGVACFPPEVAFSWHFNMAFQWTFNKISWVFGDLMAYFMGYLNGDSGI